MLDLKKIFALLAAVTFLAVIPLAMAQPIDNGLVQFTYTIRADPNYAKGGGGGKPSADYKVIYNGYKAQVPLTLTVYTSNPDGLSSTFIIDAITNAISAWDGATSAQLLKTVVTVESSGAVAYDGTDAIIFAPVSDSNTIAVSSVWASRITKQIVECDITFNTYYKWGDGTVTSSVMDFQNIATHELGHALNLADIYDSTKSYLTMYGYSDYGDTAKRTLETGDIAGIQYIYGK
jgi:hypothetical protein